MSVSVLLFHPHTGIEEDTESHVSQVAVLGGVKSWPRIFTNVTFGMSCERRVCDIKAWPVLDWLGNWLRSI